MPVRTEAVGTGFGAIAAGRTTLRAPTNHGAGACVVATTERPTEVAAVALRQIGGAAHAAPPTTCGGSGSSADDRLLADRAEPRRPTRVRRVRRSRARTGRRPAGDGVEADLVRIVTALAIVPPVTSMVIVARKRDGCDSAFVSLSNRDRAAGCADGRCVGAANAYDELWSHRPHQSYCVRNALLTGLSASGSRAETRLPGGGTQRW